MYLSVASKLPVLCSSWEPMGQRSFCRGSASWSLDLHLPLYFLAPKNKNLHLLLCSLAPNLFLIPKQMSIVLDHIPDGTVWALCSQRSTKSLSNCSISTLATTWECLLLEPSQPLIAPLRWVFPRHRNTT